MTLCMPSLAPGDLCPLTYDRDVARLLDSSFQLKPTTDDMVS